MAKSPVSFKKKRMTKRSHHQSESGRKKRKRNGQFLGLGGRPKTKVTAQVRRGTFDTSALGCQHQVLRRCGMFLSVYTV